MVILAAMEPLRQIVSNAAPALGLLLAAECMICSSKEEEDEGRSIEL